MSLPYAAHTAVTIAPRAQQGTNCLVTLWINTIARSWYTIVTTHAWVVIHAVM